MVFTINILNENTGFPKGKLLNWEWTVPVKDRKDQMKAMETAFQIEAVQEDNINTLLSTQDQPDLLSSYVPMSGQYGFQYCWELVAF
jgi:hypothetical protein